MPFCPQCGVDNPDSARFCDQCGAALVPVSASASVSASTPAASTMPPAQPITVAPNQPLVAGPTVCAQCGATAIPGEAFCDNCGAPLNAPTRPAAPVPVPPYSPGLPPQPAYPPPQPTVTGSAPVVPSASAPPPAASTLHAPPSYTSGATPPPYAGSAPPPPPPPATPMHTNLAPARMIAVASGTALQLPSVTQAVIGRNDPVSKFFPDIDLTPHGALEGGVGRRHARLFIHNGQLMVEDLDSTNGTLLNGQKLVPRQPQLVRDGDHIQFGKLLLRIQF